MRKLLLGGLILILAAGGVLLAVGFLMPGDTLTSDRPALKELPPLPPATRTSQVIAPVSVSLDAIREKMESAAPLNLEGKQDNPLADILGQADISYTINRGPLAVTPQSQALAIATALDGTVRVQGKLSDAAAGALNQLSGQLGGSIGNLLKRNLGHVTGNIDQQANLRGNVTVTSKPALTANWRIEPNLAAQVAIANGGMNVGGLNIDLGKEVKPFIDRTVNQQMERLQAMLREDTTLENAVRAEWTKMCRSIWLGAAGPEAPDLWLEMRPVRAYAAQPRITKGWAVLTVGMQAESRVVPSETKPTCPFPKTLDIVPPMDQGRVAIALPIDIPFTELNRILSAQIKGMTFPDDPNAAIHVTVNDSTINASGDRLLISLKVRGIERRSWFGLGADAVVHVWGRPVLDRKAQTLSLADIELAVESEAAFGLLGAAAQAARPQLQQALAENAVVDLKPLAENARKSIQATISEFAGQTPGMKADAQVTALRLVGIEFDSKTLRVVAEADGTAQAQVTRLP